MMNPIPATDIQNYISRCSVCEARTRIIAVHSQSMKLPDCPYDWEELWTGYSYLMSTTDNSGGFGQNLISPGSCLEEFRPQPVIECHGHGKCNYYDQLASFWLAVIEDGQQFSRPAQQTLKADHTKMISRCTVCRRIERSKERPRYEPPPTVQPPPELIAAPESRRFFQDRRQHLPHQQPQASKRRQRIHPQRNYYHQSNNNLIG